MRIIIILFHFTAICIVFSLFSRRLFDELLAHRLCFILFSKDFFFVFEILTFLFQTLLWWKIHACDNVWIYSAHLSDNAWKFNYLHKKEISFNARDNKIFFTFFILQNVFYFVLFVFAYKDHFCREDDICICVIWL